MNWSDWNMAMLFIYGFPSLLIVLSLVLGGLAFIKNAQGNKDAFITYLTASALSCVAGGYIIYQAWN